MGQRHARSRLRTRERGGREPALRRAPRPLRPILGRARAHPPRLRRRRGRVRSPPPSGGRRLPSHLVVAHRARRPAVHPRHRGRRRARSQRASRPGPPSSTTSSPSTTSPAPRAGGPSRTPSTASCERCRREALPLSVALVDLDRFKHYNDTYGHLAGDQCLVTVAKALQRRASREGELVGRFGGDEFLILWPGIDLATAVRNAERLRETVRVLDLRLAEEPVQVSVSVGGITVVPNAVHDGRVARARRRPSHVHGQGPWRRRHRSGSPTPWSPTPPTPPPPFSSLAPWTSHGAGS